MTRATVNDNTTNERFDWLNEAHLLVQFFDVVCPKMP